MSYFAIATQRFEAMLDFYQHRLGLEVISQFDRPTARGAFIRLGNDARMELIDATRQKNRMTLAEAADDRLHIVIETRDVNSFAREKSLPEPRPTSWGASVVEIRDPDNISVWVLQWLKPE
jgi:catechol 2,3-dioxygenase-like lactoylglutathione lyase family enzyme